MRNVDRELAPIVSEFLDTCPDLTLKQGRRHARIVHRLTKDFIPVAGSSGSLRARSNLRAQLRELASTGQGLIARKGGRHGC